MPDESYPEELRYHSEHDWARVEGDSATFGVTWYAKTVAIAAAKMTP